MGSVLRILVVDDDALVTQTLAGALEDTCAAQVWAAGSGEEGERLAALHKPDLILLDLDMPGRDGLDVCRALREHEDMANTTIWILTGLAPDSDRMQTAVALADQVLLKPVSLADLTLAIQVTITPRGPWLCWVTDD
jgi:two-component system phosphate regulon response regulator PhoB